MDYRDRCGQIFNSGFIQLEPVLNVIILILQQLSKKRLNKSPGTLPRLLFFVFLYPIAFYFLFSGFFCIVTFPNTNPFRLSRTTAFSSIPASLYSLASRIIITMACKTFFIASPFLWLRGTVIFAIICKQLVAYICDSGSSFSLACLHLYARRINMFAGKMRRKCSKKARPKVSLLSSVAILCIISYKFFCPLLHSHIQKVSI